MITRYSRFVAVTLFSLFLLSSCVDEQEDYISKYCPGSCTEVKGQVLQGSNGQPVQGIQLNATWSNLRTFKEGGGGTTRKKAIAYSDQHGNYRLRFLLRDEEMQDGYLEISMQGSACPQSGCRKYTYYPDELKRDTTYVLDILIP